MTQTFPYLNRIGTAVPPHDCQQEFLDSLELWIPDRAVTDKLRLIARRSGIEHRYTILDHPVGQSGSGAYYRPGAFPSTADRMRTYRDKAPQLATTACEALDAAGGDIRSATHLVITSCTGFYAPGLDIDLIERLGLRPDVSRLQIGFMGCYAGITGLRTAHDLVRADRSARVLVVNVELCTLHLQENAPFDRLVSSLLFSDGCAAAMVSGEPEGIRLDGFTSHLAPGTRDRMSWNVGDQGFEMTLDAGIPSLIKSHLQTQRRHHVNGLVESDSLWAIHPGGRAILDSVQTALSLTPEQTQPSREVLRRFGNMSSATIMFVFRKLLDNLNESSAPISGRAIAFGPGLTIESASFSCPSRDINRVRNKIEARPRTLQHPRPCLQD